MELSNSEKLLQQLVNEVASIKSDVKYIKELLQTQRTIQLQNSASQKLEERGPKKFNEEKGTVKVFIRNLAWSTTDEELNEFMSKGGNVLSAEIQTHEDTGRSKGWGLVEFSTSEEAVKAVSELDGQECQGRTVHVRLYRSSNDTTSGHSGPSGKKETPCKSKGKHSRSSSTSERAPLPIPSQKDSEDCVCPFDKSLLDKYEWLFQYEKDNLLYCKACLNHPDHSLPRSSFQTGFAGGRNGFHASYFTGHAESLGHQNAIKKISGGGSEKQLKIKIPDTGSNKSTLAMGGGMQERQSTGESQNVAASKQCSSVFSPAKCRKEISDHPSPLPSTKGALENAHGRKNKRLEGKQQATYEKSDQGLVSEETALPTKITHNNISEGSASKSNQKNSVSLDSAEKTLDSRSFVDLTDESLPDTSPTMPDGKLSTSSVESVLESLNLQRKMSTSSVESAPEPSGMKRKMSTSSADSSSGIPPLKPRRKDSISSVDSSHCIVKPRRKMSSSSLDSVSRISAPKSRCRKMSASGVSSPSGTLTMSRTMSAPAGSAPHASALSSRSRSESNADSIPGTPIFSSRKNSLSAADQANSLFPFLKPAYQQLLALSIETQLKEERKSGRPDPPSFYKCPGCKKEVAPLSGVNAHLSKCFDRRETIRFAGRKMGTAEGGNLRPVPPYLVAALKPHQLEAAAFLWSRLGGPVQRPKQQGAIIADAMGLGKTLSTVAFVGLCWRDLVEAKAKNPGLSSVFTVCVLCPATVVAHWAKEFQHWLSPDHQPPLLLFHSGLTGEERMEVLRDWGKSGGVLLSTYELYRATVMGAMDLMHREKRSLRPAAYRLLCSPGPELLILDEGHRVKTDLTQINLVLQGCTSPRRVVLTGYPLQNNLMEYWSMIDIACPGFLGGHQDFRTSFEMPISKGLELASQPILQEIAAARMHALNTGLKDVILRRESSAILLRGARDLPFKKSLVVRLGLSSLQEEVYTKVAAFVRQIRWNPQTANILLFECHTPILLLLTHPLALYRYMTMWQERRALDSHETKERAVQRRSSVLTEEVGEGWFFQENRRTLKRFKVMEYLDELDAEALLPPLVQKKKGETPGDEEKKEGSAANDDGSVEVQDRQENEQQGGNKKRVTEIEDTDCMDLDVTLSPKLMVLLELLKEFKAVGEKTLVFSQSLKSLDLIELFLELNGFDGSYMRMDGKTPELDRQTLITTFQQPESSFSVFLISTKAGGEGITLTAASRVVLFDTSFNPSNDIQASYRSYRFGQTRPVYIYRLLTAGTLEEKIYTNQLYKMALSQNIVDGKSVEAMVSKESLRKALDYDPEAKTRPLSNSVGLLEVFGQQRKGLPLNSFDDNCLESVLQKHGGATIVETFEQEEMLEESKLDSVQFTETQKQRAFEALHRLDERAKRAENSRNSAPSTVCTSVIDITGADNTQPKAVQVQGNASAAPDWEQHEHKKRRLVKIAETNDTGSLKNKEMILGQEEEGISMADENQENTHSYENLSSKMDNKGQNFEAKDAHRNENMLAKVVVIPSHLVGLVIGKKGANIKHLQEQSKTFMRIEERTPPSTYKDLVIEAESHDSLNRGKRVVLELLHDVCQREQASSHYHHGLSAPQNTNEKQHTFSKHHRKYSHHNSKQNHNRRNQQYRSNRSTTNKRANYHRAQHNHNDDRKKNNIGGRKLVVGGSILPK